MNSGWRSMAVLAVAMLSASAPAGETVARRTALEYARGAGGQPAALAQIVQLTRGLPVDAAEAIDELAAAHVRAGDLNLAASARRLLLERFPRDERAAGAALWVVRLYGSSEIAHARRESTSGDEGMALQLAAALEGEAFQRAASAPRGVPSGLPAYGLHVVSEAARANPALNDDAALGFQRAVAARMSGDAKGANKFLAPLMRLPEDNCWSQAARIEGWLSQASARRLGAAEAAGSSPASGVPAAACPAASAPPRLDGVLDEGVWNGAPLTLEGKSEQQPAPVEIRFAHDEEFFYLAVRCVKLPGVVYEGHSGARRHDGATDGDRVRLLVDLDRDYATWFELVVDSQGRTADRCCEDAGWDPEWYVAAGDANAGPNGHWTIEAAIPRAALTDGPLAGGAAWACAVERITPAGEVHSWRGPPAINPGPQHFGLLLFQ